MHEDILKEARQEYLKNRKIKTMKGIEYMIRNKPNYLKQGGLWP